MEKYYAIYTIYIIAIYMEKWLSGYCTEFPIKGSMFKTAE